MNEDTYYSLLGISETASLSEIKSAYRGLIRQVHPDTVSNLPPYLRRIAEEKAKEITEAYSVLSNSDKRQTYDSQLKEYRRQQRVRAATPPPTPAPTPPAAQPTTAQPSPTVFCKKCGTALHASGYCLQCNKFRASTSSPPKPQPVGGPTYLWAPSVQWSRDHSVLVSVIFGWLALGAVTSIINSINQIPSQSEQACLPSQRIEVNGQFVCDESSVEPSQIPAATTQVADTSSALPVVPQQPKMVKPPFAVSGTYVGTVHNETANVSSTLTTVMYLTGMSRIDGCMEINPPLYGTGALHGSVTGTHMQFEVANTKFEGELAQSGIKGSYTVSRQSSSEFGEFHLFKHLASEHSYTCDNGRLVTQQNAGP